LRQIKERAPNIQTINNIIMGKSEPPQAMIIAIMIAVAVVMLISFFLTMKIARLWLQAYFSRANITFVELIGMYLRKEDARTIVMARIMAVQGGLEITTRDLESYWLTGGDVIKVVQAMVLAKRHKIELSLEEAEKIGLMKERNVLEEVKAAIGKEI
jgi:uncharacterized protein YqfA (UPF0365 family)